MSSAAISLLSFRAKVIFPRRGRLVRLSYQGRTFFCSPGESHLLSFYILLKQITCPSSQSNLTHFCL
jgi:hypothetical protein